MKRGRKKRIGIVGLPYYAEKLSKQLNGIDNNVVFFHFDTYYSKKDKIRFLLYLPFLNSVFSLNGSITKSFVFKMTLLLKKRLFINWSGTDVLTAMNDFKKGEINSTFVQKASHSCQGKWIQDELSTIGIQAKMIQFQGFETKSKIKNSTFKILTRIGKNREEFYGMKEVLFLAKQFPEIEFTVVGIDSYKNEKMNNIHFLGWTDRMDEIFQGHTVAFRFPEHDGQSTFVLEALSYGLHCLYKYEMPGVIQVHSKEEASLQLIKLLEAFNNGVLEENQIGKKWIENNFNLQENLNVLLKYLTSDYE